MPQPNDLSRSLVALDQDSTIIAVVEMSQSSWLVAGMLPGIERQPRKKLEPSAERLLGLLHRWRDEAIRAGKEITRIAVAFEAGRDGFWLARWLTARGVEAQVIHPSSVAVSREHRRAKTDRLDTELLKRGFLGWLRGERGHCTMARIPTIAEEDAKRPNRERECLVGERTRIVNRIKSTLFTGLAQGPATLDELAATCGIPRRTLGISADAMVSLGLLERDGERYRNSEAAAAFLAGQPGPDLRPMLRFWNRISYPGWLALEEAVRAGAGRAKFGEFSTEEQQIFSAGVEAFSAATAVAVAANYDFSRHRRLLDIGGGTGSFLLAILRRHAALHGTLFELPGACEVARRRLAGEPER